MSAKPYTYRESDAARAVRVAKKAGLKVIGLHVVHDGIIVMIEGADGRRRILGTRRTIPMPPAPPRRALPRFWAGIKTAASASGACAFGMAALAAICLRPTLRISPPPTPPRSPAPNRKRKRSTSAPTRRSPDRLARLSRFAAERGGEPGLRAQPHAVPLA